MNTNALTWLVIIVVLIIAVVLGASYFFLPKSYSAYFDNVGSEVASENDTRFYSTEEQQRASSRYIDPTSNQLDLQRYYDETGAEIDINDLVAKNYYYYTFSTDSNIDLNATCVAGYFLRSIDANGLGYCFADQVGSFTDTNCAVYGSCSLVQYKQDLNADVNAFVKTTYQPIGNYLTSYTDTNWETSWTTFDANMKATFIPYQGANKDVNIWANNLWILNDANNVDNLRNMASGFNEMRNNTLLDASRSDLNCVGGVLTYTLYAKNQLGEWDFNNKVYGNDLAVASASVNLTCGTNASPTTNFIYFELVGETPTLKTATSYPSAVANRIDVGTFVVGACSGSSYTIYSYNRNRYETDSFVNRVLQRFEEMGSLYVSGLTPNANTTDVNILSGGKFFNNLVEFTSANTVKASTGFYFVKADGNFYQSTNLSDLNQYSDGTAVAGTNYVNIVWGILPITTTNAGSVASTVRLVAVLQGKPTSPYSLIEARRDDYDVINYFPLNEELRKTFVPVMRTILKPNVGLLYTFDSGVYYRDLRGRVTSGGGATTSTSTAGLVPYSGATSDLNMWDRNISAKYFIGDGSLLTGITKSVDTNFQTGWGILDANLKTTFVRNTGNTVDVNLGNNELRVKKLLVGDTNRIITLVDVNYVVSRQDPVWTLNADTITANEYGGEIIRPSQDLYLKALSVHSGDAGTSCGVLNYAMDTLLASATKNGTDWNFTTPYFLAKDTNYIVACKSSAIGWVTYSKGSQVYPVTNTYLTWRNSVTGLLGAPFYHPANAITIEDVTVQIGSSPSYDQNVTLKVDGNLYVTESIFAKKYITLSQVADVKTDASNREALNKLANIVNWKNPNGTINYLSHYAKEPNINGLNLETRISEMEKMIWELDNENIKLKKIIDVLSLDVNQSKFELIFIKESICKLDTLNPICRKDVNK